MKRKNRLKMPAMNMNFPLYRAGGGCAGSSQSELMFAGRAEDWFDIYKALELAQSLAGGRSRRKLNTLLGEASDEFERMWRTANLHRHARSNDPPTIPMTLAEAMSLLPFAIRTLLAHLVP